MKRKDITIGSAGIKFTFFRCIVYLGVFILSFCLYVNSLENSDLCLHIRIIEKLDQGRLVVPHFLYHLAVYSVSKIAHVSFLHSSSVVTALFVVIAMVMIERILRSFLKDGYSDYFLLFVSLALMFVSAIYFPLINKFPYLGIWSPNPWHNPTFIVARPVVLLCFYLYSLEMVKETCFEKRFSLIRLSILLVICTLIKPNFILAFIPASMVFCVIFSDRKMAMLLKTGLLLLPVLGVLLFQYLFTYYYDTKGTSSIQFCFFDIWQYHAKSVPFALLQGTAFPLIILALMFRHTVKDKTLLFSWALFIVGLLIFGLLFETGHRKNHANFSWTYMSCLNILFIFSTIAFLRWVSGIREKSRVFRVKIFICVSVFLLHLVSGIYYMGYLLSGHVY